MVKIRLTRRGAKKNAFYRVVALDERQRRDGRPLEFLGTYAPLAEGAPAALQLEAIDAWVSKGAQLSPTVASLVKRERRAAAAAPAAAETA